MGGIRTCLPWPCRLVMKRRNRCEGAKHGTDSAVADQVEPWPLCADVSFLWWPDRRGVYRGRLNRFTRHQMATGRYGFQGGNLHVSGGLGPSWFFSHRALGQARAWPRLSDFFYQLSFMDYTRGVDRRRKQRLDCLVCRLASFLHSALVAPAAWVLSACRF